MATGEELQHRENSVTDKMQCMAAEQIVEMNGTEWSSGLHENLVVSCK